MLIQPHSVHFDVVVIVAGRDPAGAVICAKGEWSEKIPNPCGAIAIDLDAGVKHVVLRETDLLRKTLE